MVPLTTIRLSCVLLIAFAVTGVHAKTTGEVSSNRSLAFTENKGQVTDQYYHPRPDIDFKMQTLQGISVFVGDGSLHYQWNKTEGDGEEYTAESYRLDVELVGANANAEIVSEGPSADYDHYYKEYLPLEGARAYSYNKVTYKNIYPGIDWVLYSNNNELKYDFVVHAGANPSVIKLKYTGATSLKSENGAVTIATPFGSITEGKPYTYNAETGAAVASSFLLQGNTLGFDVVNNNNTIVIDPSVNWITYYGGSGVQEFGKGVKADGSGNVYMAGLTANTTDIATTGAQQNTFGGYSDGFLVKFNAAGVRQWGTYYGGSLTDFFTSVTIDPSGDIYAAGVANSTSGIATPGANMTSNSSSSVELMLVKFDNTGSRIWGSYCYGNRVQSWTAFEGSAQICSDLSGNIFMNHTITTLGGAMKISKFDGNGTPDWSYNWQSASNMPVGVVCNASGDVYVVAQAWLSGTNTDIALAKYSNAGTPQFNNVFGGPLTDYPCGIDIDASGDIYISGETTSPTGIATSGTNRTTIKPNASGPDFDGFVMKLNGSGVKQWGTYIGNTPKSFRWVVTTGLGDRLYLAGTHDYYLQPGSLHVVNSNTGIESSSLSYTGNQGVDNYLGIAYNTAGGSVYVCGSTRSTANFATVGATQTTAGGIYNPYLASFSVDTIVTIDQPFNDTVLCAGSTFKLPYNVNNNFSVGNTFTAYLSDANGSFTSPVSIGSLTSSVSDTIVCTIPLSTLYGTGYRVRIAANLPVAISEDNGIDIRIDSAVTPVILTYTANPGTNVLTGTSVTFSTTLSGVGSTPTYQWKKNNVDIGGANSATYTGVAGTDFMTNDTITVEVGSSVACANPSSITSSQLVMTVTLGVKDLQVAGWNIYPNPSNGKLLLNGAANGEVSVQVLSMTGQQVYSKHTVANGKVYDVIELDSKLANGMYMLRIATGDDILTTRFSLQR